MCSSDYLKTDIARPPFVSYKLWGAKMLWYLIINGIYLWMVFITITKWCAHYYILAANAIAPGRMRLRWPLASFKSHCIRSLCKRYNGCGRTGCCCEHFCVSDTSPHVFNKKLDAIVTRRNKLLIAVFAQSHIENAQPTAKMIVCSDQKALLAQGSDSALLRSPAHLA